jgi:metallophosphoesterase superfamily enzyme
MRARASGACPPSSRGARAAAPVGLRPGAGCMVRRPAAAACCRSAPPACPSTARLLVADAHIGKAVSFRRLGVPVPEATTDAARWRGWMRAAGRHRRERIVFLGDLLHSAQCPRRRHRCGGGVELAGAPCRPGLVLVRGNHDRHAGDPPPRLGRAGASTSPLRLGHWRCCHEPDADLPGAYALAGHVHPGVVLAAARTTGCACPASTSDRRVGRAAGLRRIHRPARPAGAGGRPAVFAVAGDGQALPTC